MSQFHVRSNADFAPHMEGSHADFAPHIERRHSFRDQKIAQNAFFAKFFKEFFQNTDIQGVYMTFVTTFEKKKYFGGEYLLANGLFIILIF